MHFAPVLPPELYSGLDRGRYHLVQAHLIVRNNRVLELFDQWRSRGHRIILDNGAAELGEPDVTSLVSVAKAIRPSIIVSPDAFDDGDQSYRQFIMHSVIMSRIAKAIMVVPHGKSIDASVKFLRMMEQHWAFAGKLSSKLYIGVPKVMDTKETQGRLNFISSAVHNLRIHPSRIHLLGLNNGLFELDAIVKAFPRLMGVDSTLPCAAGLHGVLLKDEPNVKYALTHSEWSVTEADLDPVQWQCIKDNIEFCREYVNELQG